MSRSKLPGKMLFVVAITMAMLILFVTGPETAPKARAQAADSKTTGAYTLQEELDAWKDYSYQDAATCTDCHQKPNANRFIKRTFPSPPIEFVVLAENSIWRVHDKHAQAYAALIGKRGETMAKLMGFKSATDKKAGCLACHAMSGPSIAKKEEKLALVDGVSCGGCHGPSSEWLGPHARPTWREKDPHEKMKLGLRNLRNPEVKARLCMSCHIGNAEEGKVVTHAMFAAGHPPLPPIEIASFAENEPQHWRKARNVPYFIANKDKPELLKKFSITNLAYHRTQTALVGALVSLRETMQLTKDRANFETKHPARYFPELTMGLDAGAMPKVEELQQEASERWSELAMAHTDCYGCHHDLRYPGYRQERGFGYQIPGKPMLRVIPGRPLVRSWPIALLQPSLKPTVNSGKRIDELYAQLKTLTQVLNRRPFGKPSEITSTSDDIIKWCNANLDAVRSMKITDEVAKKLMLAICSLKSGGGNDTYLPEYESARQLAALLDVIYEDWAASTNRKDPAAKKAISDLAEGVLVRPYVKREERLRTILKRIKNDDKGIGAFIAFIQANMNDLKLLDPKAARVANSQAAALQDYIDDIANVNSEDMAKILNEGKTAETLAELSDLEQKNLLKTLGSFNPKKFVEQLENIGKLISK